MKNKDPHSFTKAKSIQEFQSLPGVGIRIAEDLWDMGYRQTSDLSSQNPEKMYEKLCILQETKVDRCMLYVFRCVVYFVREKNPNPELLKWWNWSDQNLKKREMR